MKRKLFLKVTDHHNNIIFEDFISHFDSCKHQTIIYSDTRIIKDTVLYSLTEKIENINVFDGRIIINYCGGYIAELTHKSC